MIPSTLANKILLLAPSFILLRLPERYRFTEDFYRSERIQTHVECTYPVTLYQSNTLLQEHYCDLLYF